MERNKYQLKLLICMSIVWHIMSISCQASVCEARDSALYIDFSKVGYENGQYIPAVEGKPTIKVTPTGKDDTKLLQAAIDCIASMPLLENGYRGMLQLSEGEFKITETLQVNVSGIVIKGSGSTRIVWTSRHRDAMFEVGTQADLFEPEIAISTDTRVGDSCLILNTLSSLKVGDLIQIERPSTLQWITDLGMNTATGNFVDRRIHWREGGRNLYWTRRITGIDKSLNKITLDAPLTYPMTQRYGLGSIKKLKNMPVHHVGFDSLMLVGGALYNYDKDENHSWIGIQLDRVEDVWIQHVTGTKLVASLVRTSPRTRRVTINQCRAYGLDGESAGYRQQAFYVEGQQVLTRNCIVEDGRNDYVTGLCAAGPNVFYQCKSIRPKDYSGAWESFTVGTLFDSLELGEEGGIYLGKDEVRTQGAGWTAANCIVSNTPSSAMLSAPPSSPNIRIDYSLYERQMAMAPQKVKQKLVFEREAQLPAAAASGKEPDKGKILRKVEIVNGRFVCNEKTLFGGAVNDEWWKGDISRERATQAFVSILRFIPGKKGHGHIEDLPGLADKMSKNNCFFYQTGPGLWYDRRRDEHSIKERMDAYVWAPFYELPWSRTGTGKAFDGLSLYDLSKFNDWYFLRIKEFAEICDERGMVLYYNFFNTHNILEIGAHWCDYPARPVNCINETQIPEPMPLEPRDRLHIANDYYTVKDTALLRLHRIYIEHTLNQLAGYSNIFFNLGFQYSGNAEFAKFVYKTMSDWQKRHQVEVKTLLCASKDVADAILDVPEYRSMVKVLDMRYWQYRPDGSLWAPLGGQNRAYREVNMAKFGTQGDSAPETVPSMAYKQVREYHDKYPDIALVSWHNGVSPIPAVMAGASQVLYSYNRIFNNSVFDAFIQKHVPELYTLQPVDGMLERADINFCMTNNHRTAWMMYSVEGEDIPLLKKINGIYQAVWYNLEEGVEYTKTLNLNGMTCIHKPTNGAWLLLLRNALY